jgi:hypothetical protein
MRSVSGERVTVISRNHQARSASPSCAARGRMPCAPASVASPRGGRKRRSVGRGTRAVSMCRDGLRLAQQPVDRCVARQSDIARHLGIGRSEAGAREKMPRVVRSRAVPLAARRGRAQPATWTTRERRWKKAGERFIDGTIARTPMSCLAQDVTSVREARVADRPRCARPALRTVHRCARGCAKRRRDGLCATTSSAAATSITRPDTGSGRLPSPRGRACRVCRRRLPA